MVPFRLTAPCKDYLWGGTRLRSFGKQSDAEHIAESWELSCHPDGESLIADGEWAGLTLRQFLQAHPEAAGMYAGKEFPLLIKLIDAHEDLSVQVHPSDSYAGLSKGEHGKTELWYVVDAEPGATLVYGFRERMTREEFRRAIASHTLMDKVNRVPVHPGDVFFIPAGTLHAIGKGILIAEIQQNSNTTYRVYDYGRHGPDGKPRGLNIRKALDVTTLAPAKPYTPSEAVVHDGYTEECLADCGYFKVFKEQITGQMEVPEVRTKFRHILVLEGNGQLQSAAQSIPLTKGTSVFVPSGTGTFDIKGKCTVIQTL